MSNDETKIVFPCGCQADRVKDAWVLGHCKDHPRAPGSIEKRTGHSREYWRYRFTGQALTGLCTPHNAIEAERARSKYVGPMAARMAAAALKALEEDDG